MTDSLSQLNLELEAMYMAFAARSATGGRPFHDQVNEDAAAQTMETAVYALLSATGVLSATTESEATDQIQLSSVIRRCLIEHDAKTVAAALGNGLEQLRGKRAQLDKQGQVTLRTSPDKRRSGVYFTPVSLAEAMIQPVLRSAFGNVDSWDDLSRIAILDPAAGCGAFLLSAITMGADILSSRKPFSETDAIQVRLFIAKHCIFGVDIDPVALATLRALILAVVGVPGWDGQELDSHLHAGDSVASGLDDWKRWFPDRATRGYDVILTNPPWSKLRPLKHEFFEHIDRQVRLLQGKALGTYLKAHLGDLLDCDWKAYTSKTQRLVSELRGSSEYLINQNPQGDPDLYKYFLERSIKLLAHGGRASILIPSGVLRAQGSAVLRDLLVAETEELHLTEFINRKKLFDIHSMYRFTAIRFRRGEGKGVATARFRCTDAADAARTDGVVLNRKFLTLVGGKDRLIPEVGSPHERNLLARMYQANPTPGSGRSGWTLRFQRELDMTNDSGEFIEFHDAIEQGYQRTADGRWRSDHATSVLLPLYEGRMVGQFDNCAKEYLGGHRRSARWVPTPLGRSQIIPHYFVPEDYARSRGWRPRPRAGYCDISGHANARTILASMVPAYAVCGNKVPVLLSPVREIHKHFLFIALANSFAVDWVMRRWVSTTVNQFYWQNIPLLSRIETQDAELLIQFAKSLTVVTGAHDPWELLGKRSQKRAAIDAIVMNLYGISDEEQDLILRDFPLVLPSSQNRLIGQIPLKELISLYRTEHSRDNLTLDSVQSITDSQACVSAYSTLHEIREAQTSHPSTIYLSNDQTMRARQATVAIQRRRTKRVQIG